MAVEGRYCTTIKVADLAGNTAATTQIFFIDNTVPNTPNIDITGWGEFNGIYTEPGKIADGRLVPEFVHEESKVTIPAWGEEATRLEFYVNAKLIKTSTLLSVDCKPSLAADRVFDTVIVQDKDICIAKFDYEMTQNGKDYVFQVKSIDRAGNVSLISEDEVVYYDTQKPVNPEVIHTASESYDPTPGWKLGMNSSLTKDLTVKVTTRGESLADNERYLFNPKGEQIFYGMIQNLGTGLADNNMKLGTTGDDRAGCVITFDSVRTGVCEDGDYTFKSVHTDAAGNKSGTVTHKITRDTVKPGEAKPTLLVNKVSHTLNLSISNAEPYATALVKIWGNNDVWYRTLSVSAGKTASLIDAIGIYYPSTKYTVEVRIKDKAGNIGNPTYHNVTTPSEAFCIAGQTTLTFPLRGNFIKSNNGDFFANRSTDPSVYVQHFAQDFTYYTKDNPKGKPVYSAAEGYVVNYGIDDNINYGNDPRGGLWILVYHPRLELYTFYLHFDQFNAEITQKFDRGEKVNVDTNTLLGTMGESGMATGPHLHFEIRDKDGKRKNPDGMLGICRGTGENNSGGIGITIPPDWASFEYNFPRFEIDNFLTKVEIKNTVGYSADPESDVTVVIGNSKEVKIKTKNGNEITPKSIKTDLAEIDFDSQGLNYMVSSPKVEGCIAKYGNAYFCYSASDGLGLSVAGIDIPSVTFNFDNYNDPENKMREHFQQEDIINQDAGTSIIGLNFQMNLDEAAGRTGIYEIRGSHQMKATAKLDTPELQWKWKFNTEYKPNVIEDSFPWWIVILAAAFIILIVAIIIFLLLNWAVVAGAISAIFASVLGLGSSVIAAITGFVTSAIAGFAYMLNIGQYLKF